MFIKDGVLRIYCNKLFEWSMMAMVMSLIDNTWWLRLMVSALICFSFCLDVSTSMHGSFKTIRLHGSRHGSVIYVTRNWHVEQAVVHRRSGCNSFCYWVDTVKIYRFVQYGLIEILSKGLYISLLP